MVATCGSTFPANGAGTSHRGETESRLHGPLQIARTIGDQTHRFSDCALVRDAIARCLAPANGIRPARNRLHARSKQLRCGRTTFGFRSHRRGDRLRDGLAVGTTPVARPRQSTRRAGITSVGARFPPAARGRTATPRLLVRMWIGSGGYAARIPTRRQIASRHGGRLTSAIPGPYTHSWLAAEAARSQAKDLR